MRCTRTIHTGCWSLVYEVLCCVTSNAMPISRDAFFLRPFSSRMLLPSDRNELYLQIESRENKNTINHSEQPRMRFSTLCEPNAGNNSNDRALPLYGGAFVEMEIRISTIYALPAFHSHFCGHKTNEKKKIVNVTVKVQFKCQHRPESAGIRMRRSNSLIECRLAVAVANVACRFAHIRQSAPSERLEKMQIFLVHRPVRMRGGETAAEFHWMTTTRIVCVRQCQCLHVIKSEFVPSCTQHRNRHVINVNFNLNCAQRPGVALIFAANAMQ